LGVTSTQTCGTTQPVTCQKTPILVANLNGVQGIGSGMFHNFAFAQPRTAVAESLYMHFENNFDDSSFMLNHGTVVNPGSSRFDDFEVTNGYFLDGGAHIVLGTHDGSSRYTFTAGEAVSLGAGVRPSSLTNSPTIIAKGNANGLNYRLGFVPTTPGKGKLAFEYTSASGTNTYVSDIEFNTADFTELFTYINVGVSHQFGDPLSTKLYTGWVDNVGSGVAFGQVAGSWTSGGNEAPIVAGSQTLAVGRTGELNSGYFSGFVDDVTLWDRAISPLEFELWENSFH